MSSKWHLRSVLSILILGWFLADSLDTFNIPFLKILENNTYDWRLRSTAPNTIDDSVIIADIDEKSLTELGHWPWRRDVIAELLDTLFEHYQIKQIGFDIVFSEADNDSALAILESLAKQEFKGNKVFEQTVENLSPSLKYDNQLSNSFKNRNVILGFVFKNNQSTAINALPAPLFQDNNPLLKQLPIPHPSSYTANLNLLQDSATGAGFFDNNAADADGIFRRATLIQEMNGHIYPSLSLAMLTQMNEYSQQVSLTINEYQALEGINVGYWNIPVNKHGDIFIPYRGKQGSFPYISIADIINKRTDKAHLKDKIIIVGASAPGLLDLRSTPVQKSYPGVEIHANIISGVLNGTIKESPYYSEGLSFIMLFVVGTLMILLLPKLSPAINLLSTAGLFALVTVINLLFWNNGLIIPLAPSYLLIITLFVIQIYYGFIIKSIGERHLTRTFGQYIPPEVVTELSKQDKKVDLSGENKEMTVLFTDIRGFTSISEGLSPQELTKLMNSFLTPITFAIYQQKGTIDKYMGDAVMAFWGAPLEQPEHASKALQAAFEMLQHLAELQPSFAKNGWPAIEIGIGLNSGPMNVGNMGSDYRVAYTVLGDAVNLGSRLEGLTKHYGAKIIVSETTKQQASAFSYLELDKVRVKGKNEPISIFEPLGLTDDLSESTLENLETMHYALNYFRQQQWQQAYELFTQLHEGEAPHKTYAIYLDRIQHYRDNPPPTDWDGVTTHTEK